MPGRPIRWSPEDVEKIVRLYADPPEGEGLSMRTIAAQMHCSSSAIRRLLHVQGVHIPTAGERGGTKPLSAQTVQRIVAAYQRGDSLSEVARAEHIAKTTVKRYLLAAGVTMRPKGGKRPNTFEEDEIELIEWLYWGMGYSLSAVGRYMGINANVVLKRMQRHGIPRREPYAALNHAVSGEKQQRWNELWAQAQQAGKLRANADLGDST